jgi:hypothetical protein
MFALKLWRDTDMLPVKRTISDAVTACELAGYVRGEPTPELLASGATIAVHARKDNGDKPTCSAAILIRRDDQDTAALLSIQSSLSLSGVRACWLADEFPADYAAFLHQHSQRVPGGGEAAKDLPLFRVQLPAASSILHAEIGDQSVPLDLFLCDLLSGRIRFSEEARAREHQRARLAFVETTCPACNRYSHVFFVSEGLYTTNCLRVLDHTRAPWAGLSIFRPELLNAVRQYMRQERPLVRLGAIRRRSTPDLGVSFGCFHCDEALAGPQLDELELSFLENPKLADHTTTLEFTLKTVTTAAFPHWCFPDPEIAHYCTPVKFSVGKRPFARPAKMPGDVIAATSAVPPPHNPEVVTAPPRDTSTEGKLQQPARTDYTEEENRRFAEEAWRKLEARLRASGRGRK